MRVMSYIIKQVSEIRNRMIGVSVGDLLISLLDELVVIGW